MRSPLTREDFGRLILLKSRPADANVRLSVRNVAGRGVRRLVDRVAEPGTFAIAWDGLTADGLPAAPGIYFVVLESDGWSTSRRLAWLR